MKIIVCIKQVPSSNRVEIDEITGVLKREGAFSKLNPYDLFALETAFKIKRETDGCEIIALTMGPRQAAAVLKEAVYMGADSGVLLCDRRFAGADVYATSYALSQCIDKMGGADIIICGKQTTDGDTGQVGAEISEIKSIAYSSNITDIMKVSDKSITVKCAMGTEDYVLKMNHPCLISVEKDIYTPRLPSYKRKLGIGNIDEYIITYTLDDLSDRNEMHYGLKGSPTQVERIFPPCIVKEREVLTGDGSFLANKLFSVLKEKKFV